ncbi:MAG TPA: CvpA family protein [Gemmataceae bacterium]|nr:CvpA family protein [Gemmataceae bacterium]
MPLAALSIVIMAGITYAFWREGLMTAVTMAVNVVLSGLIAFAFYEPIAGMLADGFSGSFLAGYEDAVSLLVLFAASLGVLRLVVNNLSNAHLEHHMAVRQGGIVLFGIITGYLTSGFLLCVLQTLPWQHDFLGFDYQVPKSGGTIRSVLPPDHVWLAMMQWTMPDFDKDGRFEAAYAHYRRLGDNGEPEKYMGEFAERN